jgi:hypothetical protein
MSIVVLRLLLSSEKAKLARRGVRIAREKPFTAG